MYLNFVVVLALKSNNLLPLARGMQAANVKQIFQLGVFKHAVPQNLQEAFERVVAFCKNQPKNVPIKESLFSSKYRIGIVGEISVGKSSLVNALLGLNVCPVSELRSTGIICAFTRNPSLSIVSSVELVSQTCAFWEKSLAAKNEEYNAALTVSRKTNVVPKFEIIKVPALLDGYSLLPSGNFELVDTPGLNEQQIDDMSNKDQSILYVQLKNVLKTCNVVVIVVDPAKFDTSSTAKIVSAVATCNSRFIIAANKLDLIVKPPKYRNYIRNLQLIEDAPEVDTIRATKLAQELEQRFECPVFAVSCKTQFLDSLRQIGKAVVSYVSNPYWTLRSELVSRIKANKYVPLQIYLATLSKYNDSAKVTKTVLSVVAVGFGVTAVVGGALIFLIPVVGTGGGAVAITSGLAAFGAGYGMLAGIGVIGAASIAAGSVAAATVSGISYVASRYGAALINNYEITVATKLVSKTQLAQLEDYLRNCPKFASSYFKYLPPAFTKNEIYHDYVVVEHEGKKYFCSGIFRNSELEVLQQVQEMILVPFDDEALIAQFNRLHARFVKNSVKFEGLFIENETNAAWALCFDVVKQGHLIATCTANNMTALVEAQVLKSSSSVLFSPSTRVSMKLLEFLQELEPIINL